MTDGELLKRYVDQRDEAAFAALVHRHGSMVLGVCRRVLGNDHDAEDAFQATYLVLARRASTIMPRASVGSWLFGVARRTALKARVSAARRRVREDLASGDAAEVTPRDEVWREILPWLDEALNSLPDTYRLPIILCHLEGKTHKEAAHQLGWPEGTLSVRLMRARLMLAGRLRRHGVVLSVAVLTSALSGNAVMANPPSEILANTTVSGAGLFANNQAAYLEFVSPNAAALAGDVMKTFWLARLKTTGMIAIGLAAIGLGAGGLFYQMHPSARAGAPDASEGATSEQPAPSKKADLPKPGTLRGVVLVKGDLPAPKVIVQLAGGINVRDESLLVDSKTSGLANVVVYLEKPPAGANIPAAPAAPLNVTIEGGKFVPHVLGVRVGQPVTITNRHADVEDFHSHPLRNGPINKTLAPAASFTNVYKLPEKLPLEVVNDLRPWMKHYELVVDHPWFAVTDSEGKFSIDDLPAGRHAFNFWHERVGYLERRDPVEIAAGATLDIKRVYEASRFTEGEPNVGEDAKEGQGADLNDMPRLIGTWVAVSAERQGESLPEKSVKEARIKFVISEGKFSLTTPGKGETSMTGTLMLDSNRKPKRMSWVDVKAGEETLGLVPCIYELTDDTLRICYGKERLNEFKTRPGRQFDDRLFVFEREKK